MGDFENVVIDSNRGIVIEATHMESHAKAALREGGMLMKPYGFRDVVAQHKEVAAWKSGYDKPFTLDDSKPLMLRINKKGQVLKDRYRQL